MPEAIIVIPARKGSKSIPNKNMIDICGKPMVQWTIEAAQESNLAGWWTVSTDDEELIKLCEKLDGVTFIRRPRKFCKDKSPIEDALKHAVLCIELISGLKEVNPPVPTRFDAIVLLQANIPIRRPGIIDECIRRFYELGCDSLVTVKEAREYPEWMYKMGRRDRLKRTAKKPSRLFRRQDMGRRYLIDGAIEVIKRDVLMTCKSGRFHGYLGSDIRGMVESEPKYSLEVDSEHELEVARRLLCAGERK